MQNTLAVRRYFITGSQRFSNYLWASFVSLGGAGFLTSGFMSFLERGLVSQHDTSSSSAAANEVVGTFTAGVTQPIAFFPQGLVMCFYGSLGLFFGFYLWCTIFWKVGNGFNEFNKTSGVIRIFRWGLPGKNRRIDFSYKLSEVEGLRVELKEGVNPRRTIFLQIREKAVQPIHAGAKAAGNFNGGSKGQGEGRGQKNSINIPLTRIGQPIALQDIEDEASELAQFLQVSLETERII